tara:strand:- start:654 stop:1067 length:414 start_codon:yes stop_codon:yes gene_type:complete
MKIIRLIPFILLAACGNTAQPPAGTQAPTKVIVPEEAQTIAEKPVLPPPDPARLVGLNPREVQALIGEPSLVRRDANVQAMLFESGDCVFEVIFYEPTENDHFAATETNARTYRGTDIERAICLVQILPNGQWLDQQ